MNSTSNPLISESAQNAGASTPIRLGDNAIRNLKTKARRESTRTGEKRATVLDRLAQSYGHATWAKLMRFHQVAPAPETSSESSLPPSSVVELDPCPQDASPAAQKEPDVAHQEAQSGKSKTVKPSKPPRKVSIMMLATDHYMSVPKIKALLIEKRWMTRDGMPTKMALDKDYGAIRIAPEEKRYTASGQYAVWNVAAFGRLVSKISMQERGGYFSSRYSFANRVNGAMTRLGELAGFNGTGKRADDHPRTRKIEDGDYLSRCVTEFSFGDPHCIGGPGCFHFVKNAEDIIEIYLKLIPITRSLFLNSFKKNRNEACLIVDFILMSHDWLRKQV